MTTGPIQYFIGLYQVSTIDAESLASTIKDVLLCILADHRQQYYDGVSSTRGPRKGVAVMIKKEEN